MKNLLPLALVFLTAVLSAQTGPEITSWIRNTTGATGYAGIPSNVQVVQYSTGNVYVSCTCIPGYDIGPWAGNPNTPANKNFVYKITRTPQQNTGTLTTVGLGHTGVWSNGVSIFNVDDGMSYNNQGVWKRNAYFWEGASFDDCLGHPAPNGEYHHHVNPRCLYNDTDSTHHAPIIGYAFDGFPVYGAYGFANADGSGPIKRMTSSYQLRNITTRTTLPNGSPAASAGPAVGVQFPIGCYIQDHEFVSGSGDLDEHNGRFCVTPDYPNGTYAYFVTIDAELTPVFPFTMFGTYYGIVPAGNTGPNGGHNTVSESTTVYNGVSGTAETETAIKFELWPNPVQDFTYLYFDASSVNNVNGRLYNAEVKLMETMENMQPSIGYSLDMTQFGKGVYFLQLTDGNQQIVQKIVKAGL